MNINEMYMHRCLQLAQSGAGNVAPNPLVGAVLVHNNRIIGEGYHMQYGGPHAEVNCINNVAEADGLLLTSSTIYVSLEPCAHFGKTPPCADLIISKKIPKVVIGCRDSYKEVNGKGIEKLENAGVEVVVGILENECREKNKRFFVFNERKRPYIILKWAQSSNRKISDAAKDRTYISNDYSNKLVHKWRGEEAAIMVGTNTALLDNPLLSTRLWKGNNPLRVLLDMHLRLPENLELFNRDINTIVFNGVKQEENNNLIFYKIDKDKDALVQVCEVLHQLKIQSVMIEGGAGLLQAFINLKLYDEIRIIENTQLHISQGLSAPNFNNLKIKEQFMLMEDDIKILINQ